MNKTTLIAALLLWTGLNLLGTPSVNKSIHIDEGEKIDHSLKSVNGSIRVDADAEIGGDCRTVNGSITLADHVQIDGSCETVNGSIVIADSCRLDDAQTTNGRIEIGKNCQIRGDVRTTNGRLIASEGCVLGGSLRTTNGDIEINGVDLKEDIYLSNGQLDIGRKSRIGGNIVINPSKSSFSSFFGLFRSNRRRQKPLEVYIRQHSVIEGDLIVKNDNRTVIVYIDGSSEVKGRIVNAEKRPL